LKPGDQIIQVNGMNLESASVEDYCKLLELWRSDNPDITVTVKDKQPLVLKEVPLFAE
jgi:C-terminal processing protease CtpA/Prc